MSSDRESEAPQRVDHDQYWRIEEIDPQSQVYTFVSGPPASEAVAKAKQQFARDHDVEYRDLTAKKIGRSPGRNGGPIVVVVHRPVRATHEVLP